MEIQNRRVGVLQLTVLALVAMLAVGIVVVWTRQAGLRNTVTAATPTRVEEIQKLLRQLPDQVRLEQAQVQARSQQPEDLIAAVAQLHNGIPLRSALHTQAQEQIRLWNQELIRQAQARAVVGDTRALQAAISLAAGVPPATAGYAEARSRMREWQAQIAPRPEPAISTGSVPRTSSSPEAPLKIGTALSKDSRSWEDLTIERDQKLEDVALLVTSVRIQARGDFQLSVSLTNQSEQRYAFLLSQIKLLDSDGKDHLIEAKLNSGQGIVPVGGTSRLTLYGRGRWQPPYFVQVSEVSGQRNFNLPICPDCP
ncbi:MAG: hypothetical protein H7Y22_04600 [Gemmatimonadaceae bacterium]|nr:hypothetical protein [Gloeobacterales cyanobacterium ES-bin-141]